MPRILASNAIKPFISAELTAGANNTYEFHPLHGGRTAFGYEATLLPMMCEAIMDADKAGVFKKDKGYARVAETILRGLARVGIIALVDEVTGYQDIRDRLALRAILDKYLKKEYAAWAKRFPDEFYQLMFRLKGWQYNQLSIKRPSVVGTYTNDIVYERLESGILKELQELNPKDEKGNRGHRHHQHFTADIGHPALNRHIHAVMGLMRAASNWDAFYRALQRAFPKKGANLELLLDD